MFIKYLERSQTIENYQFSDIKKIKKNVMHVNIKFTMFDRKYQTNLLNDLIS